MISEVVEMPVATKVDYVQPCNAGLQSEPHAVGRRIARMLDSNSELINRFICEGPIEEACYKFRQDVIAQLEASGWRVKITANDRFQVLPPKEDRHA